MGNDPKTKSTDKSDVTGAPVDVHKEREKQRKSAQDEAVRKGERVVQKVSEAVRKHIAPPGTP